MKKKQFDISTNDRVSVYIELADVYRQLGQQVSVAHVSVAWPVLLYFLDVNIVWYFLL